LGEGYKSFSSSLFSLLHSEISVTKTFKRNVGVVLDEVKIEDKEWRKTGNVSVQCKRLLK